MPVNKKSTCSFASTLVDVRFSDLSFTWMEGSGMSTGDTILAMTPMKRVTLFYWVCQRSKCQHEWIAKDINNPPKRCANCKRLDWNRKTLSVGRPRLKSKPKPKGQAKRRK